MRPFGFLLMATLTLFAFSSSASYLDEIQAPYLKDDFERREFHISIERQVKETLCDTSKSAEEKRLSVINPYQVPSSIHLKFSNSALEGQPATYIVGSHALRDDESNTYYFLAIKNKLSDDPSNEDPSSPFGETSLHLFTAKVSDNEAVLEEKPIQLPLKKEGEEQAQPKAQDIGRAESVFNSFIKNELNSGSGSLVASRQVALCNGTN